MKAKQAAKWLEHLGITNASTTSRTGWVVSSCPLQPWEHTDGKSGTEVFGIRDEPGDSFCSCFACGFHGSQSDLIIEFKQRNKKHPQGTFALGQALAEIDDEVENQEFNFDIPDIEQVLFGPKASDHVFPDWWMDGFVPAPQIGWAMEYLKTGREGCDPVPDQIIKMLDLRVDTEQKRVCFPVKDFKQRYMGLHGRAIDDNNTPRYRMYTQGGLNNPLIWLGESWVDFDKPILVVEGPFDLASCLRVYRNTVCPLFANPNFDKLKRMMDAMEWVTLLDRGAGGDAGREKISKACKGHVVTHLQPPAGVKDPGGMDVTQLQEVLGTVLKLDSPIV